MSKKKILVICGHPDPESFNQAIAEKYVAASKKAGNEVRFLALRELDYSPNLKFGYRKRTDLEPDLMKAIEDFKWAEHWVWVWPTWWGSVPGMMKGFLDRVFLPGFFYKYEHEDDLLPTKLMKGKTAEFFVTMGTPNWFRILTGYSSWGIKMMKAGLLDYIGVKLIGKMIMGGMSASTAEQRHVWLVEVEKKAKSR